MLQEDFTYNLSQVFLAVIPNKKRVYNKKKIKGYVYKWIKPL